MANMKTRRNRRNNVNMVRNNSTMRNNSSNSMMGGAKMPAVGTKAAVWHGSAKHTSGGLTRKDLMKTKRGRIVSKKKHAAGQKAIKKLRKLGYVAKKGQFKLFTKKSKRGGFSDAMAGSMADIAKMMGKQ